MSTELTTTPRPRPLTAGQRLRALNRTRDGYNPMRGLTMRRAVALCESYPLGEFADLMWTYGAPMLGIESADADLMALIERRTGAVLEMDYSIKSVSDDSRGFDQALADEQIACLTERYNAIANLTDVIEHLCMATFRGFSHAEKIRNRHGEVCGLELVDQWNVVRDGTADRWKYNPEALPCGYLYLPDEYIMRPENFLRRLVARPVNRIALLKVIRGNLGQKDWDYFIEIYGVPGGVITLPPNIPEGQVEEYERAAKEVAEGGSGALPHGSTYATNDSPRGVNPFRDHLEYLTQKLVLAGTGGLLTMLAESGSGTLAGGAHMEGFRTLARAEARRITASFQASLDREILEHGFPGRPHLAYFELAANEETDTSQFVADVQGLSVGGFLVDPDQVEEKTGYKVTLKPEPTGMPMGYGGAPALQNKRSERLAPLHETLDQQLAAELAAPALAASAARLESILLSATQS